MHTPSKGIGSHDSPRLLERGRIAPRSETAVRSMHGGPRSGLPACDRVESCMAIQLRAYISIHNSVADGRPFAARVAGFRMLHESVHPRASGYTARRRLSSQYTPVAMPEMDPAHEQRSRRIDAKWLHHRAGNAAKSTTLSSIRSRALEYTT